MTTALLCQFKIDVHTELAGLMTSKEKNDDPPSTKRSVEMKLRRPAAFPVHDHCAANVRGCGSTSQNPHQMEFPTVSAITANELHHAALPVTADKQNNIVNPLCVYEVDEYHDKICFPIVATII
ncbi:hypothetical protein RDI58_024753 [Solanum bulbocastanum]|uniref:Uncharacterized protein n=1 Tax=Solanum bulbocastanum TaxID=147425 RepID=A0AAN8T0E7_SOLBU